MNIGQAAKLSGISAKMIRYYEQTGLLPKAKRTDAGYRYYNQSDVDSFNLIRRARALGFSTEQISVLLYLWRDRERTSADVKAMALTHLSELKRKINELQAIAKTLETLTQHCHGDSKPDCPIIENLVNPTKRDETPPAKNRRFDNFSMRMVKN
ncbi:MULTISPECIES: Cu(I)-responsive transcriptional regulator [Providencia]|uniref:Cu(I)-responsive transcriptional regulator n=1 Tax=Providencia stuartii ATCC 25827 TaxID=471874 RepID=A0AA86YWR4_PROST|nr:MULTISPECIES: Cu(I)-responsive transcriptional regulator [Providencia]EDU58254.1 Cu(I)-responsive transcriptional regulator [Providencia stuartii ATCC 25827]SST03670.1 HTH-type transcriptional regulator [Acinetobacter baumannii]AMG67344.1 Cu(I)-responsive transcriptional regulator [Providencia stuartii]AVE42034.1 Cu(I)-responsive transcriptional regulator [Providencia stuartii]AXO19625.1 Cu(I)-responsive transcriptional regulator [Providencia stuartii]